MQILYFVLLLAGLFCFLADAFSVSASTKGRFLPLGLAFWILVSLLQTLNRL